MAMTPYSGVEDLTLRTRVKLNGAIMNEGYGIRSITVNHTINKISVAELVLRGELEIDSGNIPITDSDDFSPGVKVEILAGYGGGEITTIFKGVIVKHSVEISLDSYYTFRISCKHEAVKMTYGQTERYFEQKTDNDIIDSIMSEYNIDCSVGTSADSNENMYQKMSTDWDFILSRCDFNGFVISLDNDPVSIGAPKMSGTSVLTLEAGISIAHFEGTLNAEHQPSTVKASAWDPKTLAVITSDAAEPAMNSQGNITPGDLPSKLSQKELNLISPTPMTESELQTWADNILLRKRLAAFKGRIKFIGNGAVKTGNIIQIKGVGKKLGGLAFVSSVSHSIDASNWNTTLLFGLENNPIHQSHRFSYPSATGQLPSIRGLQLATVKKTDQDPSGMYRIQVELASDSETPVLVWARMGNLYATANAGSFFLPEQGDELILGFLDDDPRYPIIIGSLYNGKNASPYTADADNNLKAFVTRSNMKLEFNEEKKIITLLTPGQNTIIISDEGKSVEIIDENKNNIKLSPDGISLDSASNINISAKGNININASAKINVSAKADLGLSGLNINAQAQVGFAGKGNATAELSATGQTIVKGTVVMIN